MTQRRLRTACAPGRLHPTHAGTVGTLTDDGAAGGLDDAEGDRQLLLDELGIAYAFEVLVEVVLGPARFRLLGLGTSPQLAQGRQQRRGPWSRRVSSTGRTQASEQ